MEELTFMYHIKKNREDGQELKSGPLVNTPFNEELPEFMMIVFYFSPQMVAWKADIFKCKITDDSGQCFTYLTL